MTISSQCLDNSEKAKLDQLRRGKTPDQLIVMDKQLAKIIEIAINGAGELEAKNIKTRIALALRRKFPLG